MNVARQLPVYEGMRSVLSGTAVSACLILGTACTVTSDSRSHIAREEKRFTVSETSEVRLTTFDGSIEVRSWDRPEVRVEIEKRGPTKDGSKASRDASSCGRATAAFA
jgi:hypothetical protein